MTRFRIIAIFNDAIYTSIEFNGDGYFTGWGHEVCEKLDKCKTYEQYAELVKWVNDEGFEYPDQLIWDDCSVNDFDFYKLNQNHEYFNVWFSDYLYIKNFTDSNFLITDENGTEIIVHPDGYVTINFGEYYVPTIEDVKVGFPFKNIDVNWIGRFRKILARLEWNITEEGDSEVYISRYTPAGEDYGFSVDKFHIAKGIKQEAENFDVDEHTTMWIGGCGAPTSIRTLLEDAEWIENELWDLAEAVEEVKQ